MNVVLLSGGSGKRLWPLSNDVLSKQFLKLLKAEKGNYESMVQRVVKQLTSNIPNANIFVSCNQAQVDMLQRQLGTVETISEPARRDTFPAIVLAAAHLRYNKQLSDDDSFVVLPIDVFAEDSYFTLLREVEGLTSDSNIGLLGAIPTYPSEKYGYISHTNGNVIGFEEKPNIAEAEKLINQNALWNCGVVATKIGYVLDHARKYVDFDNYEPLYSQYDSLPKISFDYEVIEKEPSIQVVTYKDKWKDLGTWNTFAEEMGISTHGNVIISDTSNNTHALNMLNIPIIVQDVSDAVVIASHDGILVTSKPGSSYLKALTEQVSNRPMYEQRKWGDYRVLDYKAGEPSSIIKRVRIDAGKEISCQYHTKRCEVWVVVKGKGILTIGEVDSVVSTGSVIQIPDIAKHSLLAATEMELVEVQLGHEGLLEDA